MIADLAKIERAYQQITILHVGQASMESRED